MIKRRRSLILESLFYIRKEIGFLNEEVSIVKKMISLEDKSIEPKNFELVKLAKTELRIKKLVPYLFTVVDSLSDSSSKKKLFIDANKLLDLRVRIANLLNLFNEEIHVSFFGVVKGKIAKVFKEHNLASEKKELLSILRVLQALISELSYFRNELLRIEKVWAHKNELAEREFLGKESLEKKDSVKYRYYFHASEKKWSKKDLLGLKEGYNFFFAKTIEDAKQLKLSHSGGSFSSLYVVKIRLSADFISRFVKPFDMVSYADANLHCFYFDKREISQINRLIKRGDIVLSL